jgi:glycosyltransferase involved in cell wall biosynthesis
MKIALVVPGGVDRSGEYRVIPVLVALISRLARHHEVHVFALAQEPVAATWRLAGACVHNVGSRARLVRALAAVHRENRAAAFDIIHAIWSGGCGLVAVTSARILGVPAVVHVAGGELAALPEIGYGGRLRWFGRVRENLVLRSATAVSAASAPIIDSIAKLGVRAQRVPLGVDLQTWPPREPTRRGPGVARLIHVASLNAVKDQATLLHALAMLDASGVDFHMDIVGEDTLRGQVQALASELGLNRRTTFHGFLTQRRLRSLVEQAHVHVVSSRHEAGPVALLEAAVAGVPTVGTAVGHIAEWAPTAALSTPPGRPAELSSAIALLLDDEVLRLKTAREAFHRAVALDADSTAKRFLEIYGELGQRDVRELNAGAGCR